MFTNGQFWFMLTQEGGRVRAPRKCSHGYVKSACAHCIDDRNHGVGQARREIVVGEAPRWKAIVEWRKKKASARYETQESYLKWLAADRGRVGKLPGSIAT